MEMRKEAADSIVLDSVPGDIAADGGIFLGRE